MASSFLRVNFEPGPTIHYQPVRSVDTIADPSPVTPFVRLNLRLWRTRAIHVIAETPPTKEKTDDFDPRSY
jgi:hypothetical protein